jgi:hypothetical protein
VRNPIGPETGGCGFFILQLPEGTELGAEHVWPLATRKEFDPTLTGQCGISQ